MRVQTLIHVLLVSGCVGGLAALWTAGWLGQATRTAAEDHHEAQRAAWEHRRLDESFRQWLRVSDAVLAGGVSAESLGAHELEGRVRRQLEVLRKAGVDERAWADAGPIQSFVDRQAARLTSAERLTEPGDAPRIRELHAGMVREVGPVRAAIDRLGARIEVWNGRCGAAVTAAAAAEDRTRWLLACGLVGLAFGLWRLAAKGLSRPLAGLAAEPGDGAGAVIPGRTGTGEVDALAASSGAVAAGVAGQVQDRTEQLERSEEDPGAARDQAEREAGNLELAAPRPRVAAAGEVAALPGLSPCSVLVVEPESVLRQILERELNARHCARVVVVEEALAAIEIQRRQLALGRGFDLVLVAQPLYQQGLHLGGAKVVLMAPAHCAAVAGVAGQIHRPLKLPQLHACLTRFLGGVEAPTAEPRSGEASQGCSRVLVVDDNRINLRVASKMLTLLGCAFETATDGDEAIEKAAAGDFDLILMDCQMPGRDGLAATAVLRARGFTKPIIALTANAMAGDQEKCLEAGMNDFLAKPIRVQQLGDALSHWVRVTPLPG